MYNVKPKKHLGQHFLKNENTAMRIFQSLTLRDELPVLEIGPGTGVLTKFFEEHENFKAFDVDVESIDYLKQNYSGLVGKVFLKDILKADLHEFYPDRLCIIGNFPYNISSQIFFKAYHNRNKVTELVGMVQKEVAERICSSHGSKVYGILSVLIQAFYNTEYLFTVHENEFTPPPKVKSAVLRLVRNEVDTLPCNEELFFKTVKAAFNHRRKTLRNSLKDLCNAYEVDTTNELFNLRPEQLDVDGFIQLTQLIEKK